MGDLQKTKSWCCACRKEQLFQFQEGERIDRTKQICETCIARGYYIARLGDLCQRGIRAFKTVHELHEAYKAHEAKKKVQHDTGG